MNTGKGFREARGKPTGELLALEPKATEDDDDDDDELERPTLVF